MVDVFLHGILGQKFGEKWSLNVKNVGEAIKAINCNTKQAFRKFIIDNDINTEYVVIVDGKDVDENEIKSIKANKEIHISPAIEFANDTLKIIAGIILVIVGAYFYETPIGPYLVDLGIALILGGVAGMLVPKPKIEDNGNPSTTINNSNVVVRQGYPVQVVYGKAFVSPLPISSFLKHFRIYGVGDYDIIYRPELPFTSDWGLYIDESGGYSYFDDPGIDENDQYQPVDQL